MSRLIKSTAHNLQYPRIGALRQLDGLCWRGCRMHNHLYKYSVGLRIRSLSLCDRAEQWRAREPLAESHPNQQASRVETAVLRIQRATPPETCGNLEAETWQIAIYYVDGHGYYCWWWRPG